MPRKKRQPWRKRCGCGTACTHAYWLQVRVGSTRRWVNLSETFPDDELSVAAAKAKTLTRAGKLTPATSTAVVLTVADVAKLYRAARTCKNDVYIDHFVASPALSGGTIGDKKMDDVTTADVKHACGKRVNDARRHFLQAARHLFSWSIKEGHATRTPFKTMQGAVLISVPQSRKRTRRLEDGEEQRIRDVGDAFINDFLTAMLSTGCRPGELRTLQWSEVTEDRIVVLASKAKTKKLRKLPILPELQEVLNRRRKAPDGTDLPSEAYVFGDDTGRLMTRERLCERWRATCATARVVGLHLHDLRGEFASMMAESGVPTHLVRDTLGHSSLTMTNTYLRSRTDSLDDAFNQLQRGKIKLVKGAAAQG